MRIQRCALLVLVLLLPVSVRAQGWDKYIPNKKHEREKIKAKAERSGSTGGIFRGYAIKPVWVTDQVARALISREVDEERLSNEEADRRLASLRSEKEYIFFVPVITVGRSVDEPVTGKGLFLQRAENRKVFSRGMSSEGKYSRRYLNADQYAYIIHFPKVDENGQPLIKSIDDIIEISVLTTAGTAVAKFKIKDFVSRLEEL